MAAVCTEPGCPNLRPCPTHKQTGHRSTWRDRSAQRRFSRAVLQLAGHQCQAIEHGTRCPTTTGLQAHHTQPGNDDPSTGVALCTPHHRAVDPHAR